MNHKILYCFTSYQKVLEQDKIRISQMCETLGIEHFLIACGGANTVSYKNHVLKLTCNDYYEGLPSKVYEMFKFAIDHLPQYQHYAKLDRTTLIRKPIDFKIITDYLGKYCIGTDRFYHKDKCSAGSEWNNKPYNGIFIPVCQGGPVYFISHKATNLVAQNPPVESEEIYEDQYVGKILNLHGKIFPTNFPSISEYCLDREQV